ncbi:carbon monoxide dehydrogenase subunit G [Pseudohalocynthiibacter aestuariivivens]|uniref:Carbon monoxide dehydrogenase subunit G n=1 Tax=Pseudohalocynthiibacter aestuariivivens TaxID=1591409 RepID=A0ABV5JEC3_9RHOB|nr:carbon monoxide dehydrogenase subunit G [Pseudohalocynthiibacter aestuariivivens]MBS9718809.1 carbon monoxide dehydrogenase subunit G [Pseudohalocynthiibacter aestuariivivens]
MDMNGEKVINAPQALVWQALNDPDMLRASIPGCQELERTGENGFEATVKAKVGPVSAKFAGVVELLDINAPESYRISGEGKGGVAGFASGHADVKLIPDGDTTTLVYTVNAKVGGKLAQIGSRLIDSAAKKMANQFFTKFSENLEGYTPETSSKAAD